MKCVRKRQLNEETLCLGTDGAKAQGEAASLGRRFLPQDTNRGWVSIDARRKPAEDSCHVLYPSQHAEKQNLDGDSVRMVLSGLERAPAHW